MDFSPELVHEQADAYSSRQPLHDVEEEHREMLPSLLRGGDFGWRDPQWVVQWYFRRHLGAYPDAARREAENAYGKNSYEAVSKALTEATETDETEPKLAALTELTGVNVSLASAFLHYLHPERYIVGSRREWSVLATAGRVESAYPEPFTARDCTQFIQVCREIATECDCSLQTVYQALWMLSVDYEFPSDD